MINKRLLIKNLLSHNDENSFYDKKEKLSLHHKEGKAKFIKHICALSNSNPTNNSYILIGIEDEENKLKGVSTSTDDLAEEIPEEKSDISAKLRMYEQRLAAAEETATRIWN